MPTALTTRPNDFATALRTAVDRSGLCLESIQQRLAERDVQVSVATLSYWQSGNRVPGRKRSEMVVAHLESVLGLAPRSLRVLVPAPRPRGPVRAPDKFVLAPHFNERDAVRAIAERVQATQAGHQLTRISQHDVVRIDEDRRMESVHIRTVARADNDGLTGMGVTQFFEDATAGSPRLTVNSGASIRAQHLDPAHRVIGTELEFAQCLGRGDTVVLDYEISSDGPGPRDFSYDTSCARSIRECVVEVHFHPHDLPAWVESYQRAQDRVEVRRRVPVDALGHAHVVVLDAAPGTTGLEWSF
ncbi:hypothetical protein ncot_02910 [Nocardioides sp. JQ2195]|uniref:hypothetical protein n=1 Tax=Nocardioides sp. JQ2195 TaxID=2592334 RepID=UPI00143E907F|nr:hypothetical protein [Nocardioides sp. JQ2195]QIX25655.1 hypothetical protein ncot_02910 [Nocardioides sp. JQ2195]